MISAADNVKRAQEIVDESYSLIEAIEKAVLSKDRRRTSRDKARLIMEIVTMYASRKNRREV